MKKYRWILAAALAVAFGYVWARSHPRWRGGSLAADWDFYRRGQHLLRLPHGAPPPEGWQKAPAPHGLAGGRLRGVRGKPAPGPHGCANPAPGACSGKKSSAVTLPEG